MKTTEFEALAVLLRLRQGASREAVRRHLVDGLPVAEAAEATGISYRAAWQACKRAKQGLELARRACGAAQGGHSAGQAARLAAGCHSGADRGESEGVEA